MKSCSYATKLRIQDVFCEWYHLTIVLILLIPPSEVDSRHIINEDGFRVIQVLVIRTAELEVLPDKSRGRTINISVIGACLVDMGSILSPFNFSEARLKTNNHPAC